MNEECHIFYPDNSVDPVQKWKFLYYQAKWNTDLIVLCVIVVYFIPSIYERI